MILQDRPINIPLDWVLRECANPECPHAVWVPDASGWPAKMSVLPVHSAYCAKTVAEQLLARHTLEGKPSRSQQRRETFS